MDITLKSTLSNKKTFMILSAVCVLLGALSCVLGELLLPALVGVLAALYLFDRNNKNSYSFWVSVILLVLNAAAFLTGISISFFGIAAVILAKMICSAFVKNQSKADTAYLMTLISAIFTVVSCILLAMALQNVYTLDAAMAFYKDFADYLKEIFLMTTMQIYSEAGVQVTEEMLVLVFDQQVSLIISYLVIGSFVIVGLSMKLFGLIVSKCAEDNTPILKWRFITTNVYAYFYVILAFASVFVNPIGNVLGVSVMNLYNIFMVVFAYVGFNYALALLRRRMKRVSSFILLSIITLVFMALAIELLSFLGAIFTIRKSREIRPQTPLNP